MKCKPQMPILVMVMFTVGCGSPQDVTHDPAFGNFASVVGTWETKVPLKRVEIDGQLCLMEVQYARHLDGDVLPVGTEIHIEQLIFRESLSTNSLHVIGGVVDKTTSENSVRISSSLFLDVDDSYSSSGKYPVASYYSIWHDESDPKPDWIPAPDKLERLSQ